MTKLNLIDLFAGAGGFGLGFKLAGYDLQCSLEIDKWASDTLKANCGHKVINDSILNFKSKKEILGVVGSRPDIIIGGPPCQGFSQAGRRDVTDPRNKLYIEYLRWIKIFSPKLFVIENVGGLVTFKKENGDFIINDILESIKEIGYFPNVWLLNAADYGVPQNRERIFIVASQSKDFIPKPPATHSFENESLPNPVTVSEAISDLPFIQAREGEEIMDYTFSAESSYQETIRENSEKVFNHVAMKHTRRIIDRYQQIIEGKKLEELSDDLKVRKRNGKGELSEINFSLNYRYLSPNSPSFTIPAHFYSSFVHPTVPRNITTREAARIQSFPDNYKFMGKRTMISAKLLKKLGKEELNHLSQYNQVGNAVPPLLAKQIGEYLKNFI